jgi:hypothetical protein
MIVFHVTRIQIDIKMVPHVLVNPDFMNPMPQCVQIVIILVKLVLGHY